jgi:plasmid maintenance system antidote protein VapI
MGKQETYLEKQIRAAIKKSGLTIYRLAKDSGVSQPVLSRFVNRQRGITLATASKLVETLGLKLISKKKKSKN